MPTTTKPTKKPEAKAWGLEDVEHLSSLMKKDGITLIELNGLKLIRAPQQSFYEDLAKKGSALEQRSEPVTDDDILMDPMAGLKGAMTNG